MKFDVLECLESFGRWANQYTCEGEKNMKQNRLLMAGAALWVLVVLSASALSAVTLAKYSAFASGSTTGTIAKWVVSAGTVTAAQPKYANSGAAKVSSSVDPVIAINNGSEVTTDFYFELKTTATAYPASTPNTFITAAGDAIQSVSIAASPAPVGASLPGGLRVRLNPGGSASVVINTQVTTAITSTNQSGAYRKFEVHVYAIQVD